MFVKTSMYMYVTVGPMSSHTAYDLCCTVVLGTIKTFLIELWRPYNVYTFNVGLSVTAESA